MKDFLYEIKTRIGKKFLKNFWNLLVLYVYIIIKKDFTNQKNNALIDVVIPTTDKDLETLSLVVKSLKNVGNKINNVYIVAPTENSIVNFCKNKNIILIDELKVFGFGKEYIKNYTVNGLNRNGWLFQQFLKYGMKDLVEQENYLILDSDTVLLNIVTFIEKDKFVFFKNTEWHKIYFEVFETIFGYKNKSHTSFTSHMMIFNKNYINDMLAEIEQKGGDKWYNVIQNKINKNEMSAVSDYENYGQWMYINHGNLMREKPLYNKALKREKLTDLDGLIKLYHKKYQTLSFHNWIKK